MSISSTSRRLLSVCLLAAPFQPTFMSSFLSRAPPLLEGQKAYKKGEDSDDEAQLERELLQCAPKPLSLAATAPVHQTEKQFENNLLVRVGPPPFPAHLGLSPRQGGPTRKICCNYHQ